MDSAAVFRSPVMMMSLQKSSSSTERWSEHIRFHCDKNDNDNDDNFHSTTHLPAAH